MGSEVINLRDIVHVGGAVFRLVGTISYIQTDCRNWKIWLLASGARSIGAIFVHESKFEG